MALIRSVVLTSGLALSLFAGVAISQSAHAQSMMAPTKAPAAAPASGAKPTLTVQIPALPDPVAVTLKPATTALFLSDMVDPMCKTQPKCTQTMVPAVASLLAQARKAGVLVVYSTQADRAKSWMPEIAPQASDPFIAAHGQDRFFDSDLDKTLKDKGITTVVLTGWKISGSVLYTSVGATLRGYTVVVPKDASLSASDYEDAIGVYMVLNQNAANPTNQPLKPKTSTLSQSNMITFQ